MKHSATTIADLLWVTAMVACMCYLWLVADSRQVQFQGTFSSLPPNDDALVEWLEDSGWTVDEVDRDDSAEWEMRSSPSDTQSLRVIARGNYFSDGRFAPPWEELGYKKLALRSIGTHPEPMRLILFFVFWFAASIPLTTRWLHHRIRKQITGPRAAE